jgi:hypothetical protein
VSWAPWVQTSTLYFQDLAKGPSTQWLRTQSSTSQVSRSPPSSLGGVPEWAVDVDLLVMGGQGSWVLFSGTSDSATCYNTVCEGDYSVLFNFFIFS